MSGNIKNEQIMKLNHRVQMAGVKVKGIGQLLEKDNELMGIGDILLEVHSEIKKIATEMEMLTEGEM